ncbi:hypothetical protein M405DRAFT_832930 [Rhizopogon salebrosus TDB-379]|nr:hypothetical protein M405DRAFT_832930 [Rhizopogon salebrosus TDB-379]
MDRSCLKRIQVYSIQLLWFLLHLCSRNGLNGGSNSSADHCAQSPERGLCYTLTSSTRTSSCRRNGFIHPSPRSPMFIYYDLLPRSATVCHDCCHATDQGTDSIVLSSDVPRCY